MATATNVFDPWTAPDPVAAPDEELLTPMQCAFELGVTEGSVKRYISAGTLASVKLFNARRVTRTQLDAFQAAMRAGGYKLRMPDADPPIDPTVDWGD